MSENQEQEPTARVVEDLTRRAGAVEGWGPGDVPGVIARVTRADESLEVVSLEAHAAHPLRQHGSTAHTGVRGFAAEVRERATDDGSTTLWAYEGLVSVSSRQPGNPTITAIFNDHATAAQGDNQGGGDTAAGWRDLRAVLTLEKDPGWVEWRTMAGAGAVTKPDGTLLAPHKAFADFIEDHVDDIVADHGGPDSATMLEVARTFQAQRNVDFTSAVRTQTGTVAIEHKPSENARGGERGELEVPAEFHIDLPIYQRASSVVVTARLRWNLDNEGNLTLGYKLHRPDRIERQAFDLVLDDLHGLLSGDGTEGEQLPGATAPTSPWPIYLGTAPSVTQVDTDLR